MRQTYSPFRFFYFPFLIALTVACLYGVYKENPYLMAQEGLYDQLRLQRGADFIVMQHPRSEFQLTEDDLKIAHARHEDLQRSRMFPEEIRPTHRWAVLGSPEVAVSLANEDESSTAIDSKGAYFLTLKQFTAVKLSGETMWSFSPPGTDTFVNGPIATTARAVTLATAKGRLYTFEKNTGQILWYSKSESKYLRSPIYTKRYVYAFAEDKPDQTWALLMFERESGKFVQKIARLSQPLVDEVALNTDETSAYFTTPKALYAIDLVKKELSWKVAAQPEKADEGVENKEPVKEMAFTSGPTVSGDRVYAITSEGMATAYDGRNGRPMWTTDLAAQVSGGFSALPDAFKVYVRDRAGYIHALNSRTGKREWRFNTAQNGPFYDLYLMRMRGSSFADLKVVPKTRYWTVWTYCGGTRLCIFAPEDGQPYMKTELKGRPLSDPFIDSEGEDMWIATAAGKNIQLTHFIEEKKLKAIREAEKSAMTRTKN